MLPECDHDQVCGAQPRRDHQPGSRDKMMMLELWRTGAGGCQGEELDQDQLGIVQERDGVVDLDPGEEDEDKR